MTTFMEKLTPSGKTQRFAGCVGLDPELKKIPLHLRNLPDPIVSFCRGSWPKPGIWSAPTNRIWPSSKALGTDG